MKPIYKTLAGICVALTFVTNATALVHYPSVYIEKIYLWQDNNSVVLELSNNERCYVPASEVTLKNLAIGLHLRQTKVELHCFDNFVTTQGIAARRVHRLISNF